MSGDSVPKKLRQKIARRAKERCGYCLVSAPITGMDLQVEGGEKGTRLFELGLRNAKAERD